MGTADQLFVLRHILAQHKRSKSKLYMCFVDFKKAYDSVRRDLLLAELAQKGVDGPMLQAIAAMYSSVSLCARQAGQLSQEFPSTLGVKQGDPLSPLLFGLFLDGVEGHVQQQAPRTGVHIGGALLQMLLYAGDIVLLARSEADLQAQLDALHGFCEAKCMTVYVAKTKVMVFNGAAGSQTACMYAGEVLQTVDTFHYLGIDICAQRGMQASPGVIRSAGLKAMWGLASQLQDREISSIGLRVQLFDNIVMPVLQYGCEVWSTQFLQHPAPAYSQQFTAGPEPVSAPGDWELGSQVR
jgi:hypothetical protein